MVKSLLVASVILAAWPDQNTDHQWSYEVERAARTYRIQVYNTFRTDRPQFDRLQATGAKAVDAWKKLGRQPAEARQVIDWFGRAATVASAGQTSLPREPEFVASWTPTKKTSPQFHPNGAGPSVATQQSGPQLLPPDPVSLSQPDLAPSDAEPDPSIVRGLGRALLSTVGVRGNNGAARRNEPRELPAQEPSDTDTNETASDPAPLPSRNDLEMPSNPIPNKAPEVDLDDLKARVDGFNPAISAVSQILESDAPVSTDQFAILVEELETLIQNYQDLRPYLALDSLSESDRSYVGNLESPRESVDRLRERIQESIAELEPTPDAADSDVTDSDDTSNDLANLNDLLERVNRLEFEPQS